MKEEFMKEKFEDLLSRGPYLGFYPTDDSPTAYAECEVTLSVNKMIVMRVAQHENNDHVQEMGTVDEVMSIAEKVSYDPRIEELIFRANDTTIVFCDKVDLLLQEIPDAIPHPNLIIVDPYLTWTHLGGSCLYKKGRMTDKFREEIQAQLPYPDYASEAPRLKYGDHFVS